MREQLKGDTLNDNDKPLSQYACHVRENVSDIIVLKRFNAILRSSHTFDWCVIECINERVIECVNERCAMNYCAMSECIGEYMRVNDERVRALMMIECIMSYECALSECCVMREGVNKRVRELMNNEDDSDESVISGRGVMSELNQRVLRTLGMNE
ncbi:hypothetical protein DPMN_039754 [Dreissena polymorpha]|uniref:Uncharacterized protein n=1 Tax=Dreissena polymorpha TaxID=45954 RepID=A0A9D4HUN4_DREPO|nr:hypothetical protein DPMN_039754 [Dreissena polymorpha]